MARQPTVKSDATHAGSKRSSETGGSNDGQIAFPRRRARGGTADAAAPAVPHAPDGKLERHSASDLPMAQQAGDATLAGSTRSSSMAGSSGGQIAFTQRRARGGNADAAPAHAPEVTLERRSASDLPHKLLLELLDLVEGNVSSFYGAEWDAASKMAELTQPGMCLLLCRDPADSVLAAAAYMLDEEEGVHVCYLYELQVDAAARGMGLGSKLMDEVERLGRLGGAKGVMLTVHAENVRAQRFYTERCGFEVSPVSPTLCAAPQQARACDYIIMQRIWDEAAREELRRTGSATRERHYLAAMRAGHLRIRLTMRG